MKKRALSKRTSAVRQDGQALVFALLFTAAAGLMGLLLFNSGMLANAKTRLQNAADAGAYSAGVLQARDHNFSAYTNRAMVANQAAVAQIVSIKSYLEDAKDTYDRMGGALLDGYKTMFPSVEAPWNIPKSTIGPLISAAKRSFDTASPVMVKTLDALIKSHELAQQLHHATTALDMAKVAEEVVKRNDPLARLSSGTFTAGPSVLSVAQWSASTTQHRANDSSAEADRFADVVVSARTTDRFTRERGSTPAPVWASTVKSTTCPPSVGAATLIVSFTHFNFFHSGGTLLSGDKKRWLALDATTGLGNWMCAYLVPTPWGPVTVFLGSPLAELGGSGGGLVGASGGYGETTGYKNNPGETANYGNALFSVAAVPAWERYSSTGPGSTLDSKGGLQDYYRDMSNPTKSIPKNQSPEENGGKSPVVIEVERPATSIRTSSKLLTDASIIKLDDQLASASMRSVATAHAYFYRSRINTGFTRTGWARSDDRTEVASLFNPYWQARLIDTSAAHRAISLSDQMK